MLAMPFASAVVAGRPLHVIECGRPSMWIFPLPGNGFAADEGSR